MKKALLISYFFPPAQSVAGARAFSWANYFAGFGIQSTVVTRHWKGDETTWLDLTVNHNGEVEYERFKEFDIYKLPSKKIGGLKILEKYFSKSGFFRKFFYLLINAMGHLNAEADARSSFRKFLFNHLQTNKYDFIIVSSPPLNIIRLAADLKRKFNIPVHADFRDLWNNGYLNPDYHPAFKIKLIDWFKKRYLQRWMKDIDSVSTVSAPIAVFLEEMMKKKCWVLTNGFDETLYINKIKRSSPKFRISLLGSYYGMQNMDVILSGLKLFLMDKSAEDIIIFIVGLNVNDVILNNVLKSLPAEFISKIDRVSAKEAADYAINTEVILHVTWKGFKGIYTTKLFDFIASGNNILLTPGDNDVADELIDKTKTGKIAGDAKEAAAYLESWFWEWKNTGAIAYCGNKEMIERYNRKGIASHFATLLKNKYV